MSGLGEQTIGNGWSCAQLDVSGWAQIAARCRPRPEGNAGNSCWNSRGVRCGSCSSNRTVSSTNWHLLVMTPLRYGDELCRWFGLPHGHFCTLAKLMIFAGEEVESTSLAKKILDAWSDVYNDEDAVKYASGCWPRAFTNRWYSVTGVERPLTSPPLVASSDSSRCSQTLVGFRKIVSEKQGQATSNQTKPLGTRENTKDMLTAIDTAGTSNETLALFQARESWWQREVMDNFNVPAFHFVMHVLHQSRGPTGHALNRVSVTSTRSVAVDRVLPSRVPTIEFVPLRRGSSMTITSYSRNLGSWIAHTTSLCQMPGIVRMSVARICAMPMSAASLCKQFWDKRLTMTPRSQLRSQSTP